MPKFNLTHTLSNLQQGSAVMRILQAALDAADPAQAVLRAVQLQGQRLIVLGVEYDLSAYRQIHLLSFGKAGWTLARALEDLMGGLLSRGLVVAKTADQTPPGRFTIMEGGHPIPDERSLAAGEATRRFLGAIGPDDLLICAISGGGSALIAAPRPPIKLTDLRAITARLLACGATIDEINTSRRHLDILKGGGFLLQTKATVLSLILSDVVGNSLEAIASGPTAADPSTRADALRILQKYNLLAVVSEDILSVLQNAPETLKPGNPRLETVRNALIGSNLTALHAALRQAADEGFHPYLLRTNLTGEAREAAFELSGALRWACQRGEPVARPFCMVAGGETTVTLRGNGRGGRNTELALAAVTELVDFPNALLVTLATDGEDGPTDAAGAVVSGATWRRAQTLGLHPGDYLQRNDSYSFFAALDDLLKTGPTGTNVNDLVFLFGF
ncbi:MAG: glycerate kinase [Anaerolineales bacterium]